MNEILEQIFGAVLLLAGLSITLLLPAQRRERWRR